MQSDPIVITFAHHSAGNEENQVKKKLYYKIANLSCQQMDDLERMLYDPGGHQLFAVVPSVHHQRVGQSLHNRTLCLPEPFHLIPTAGVG